MSAEETIETRQDSELEALKAIYGDEVRDLRKKKAWNRWAPLDVCLTLRPLIGSSGTQEIHTGVDLRIKCSENYPNITPTIELRNTRGMSKALVNALRSELESKAVELTGEVMIFELAQHVQGFLHQHNKPASKSFYEEMILRNKQIQRMEEERLQLEYDRKKQCMLDEVQRRQEILKLESKKHREYRLSSENSSESGESNRRRSSSGNHRCNNSCELSDEMICSHQGTEIIEFSNNGLRVVSRGRCIYHSQHNSVIYSGIDRESGQLYNVTEWIVDIKPDLGIIQRQISSIENELNYLVKLKHHNLAHYLNSTHQVLEQQNKVVLHVLQEFIFGVNCRGLYLHENIPIEMDMLRHLADGVLNALDFLHRNNVVHKDLTGSCVYLCKNGVVKVSDYSLDKRLSDLVTQAHSSNYNKKADIFKFGLLMLSLLKGSDVCDESIEMPPHISHELHDFLDNCLLSEEKDRYTALQLLNHPFLKVPLTRLSPHRHIDDKVPDRRNSSPEMQVSDIKMLAQSHSSGLSRVGNEFELLDHLGKGAYGDVFKVQNKLDQGYYALKRIELNPRNKQINKKIIREVKLLSRLNHENVVRYYNSWIETATITRNEAEESTTSSVTTPSVPASVSNKKEVLFREDDDLIEKLAPPVRDVEWSISYGHKAKITEGESSSSSEESSDEDDENWGLGLKNLDDSSDSDCIEFEPCDSDLSKTMDITASKNEDIVESQIKLSKEIQFMYIQMEFCEKSTLRNAIDTDLYLDNDRVWRLFREIVEGLLHIHQQGMIHRDLKPMNVFLDYNDHVKIGDFGLATTNFLAKPSDSLSANKSYNDTEGSHDGGGDPSMTGHIGTALYVAPELTSTAKAVYNQKVDIYSLGVIFFEMCYKPLKTSMERINVLTRLRSNEIVFPSDFQEKGTTNQQHVIRWLLDHNVSKRPASQELLQSDKLPPPVLEECKLRELVRHTLSNSQLKGYKYLVESCFKQVTTQAQDITYDKDISVANAMKNLQTYNHIRSVILKVFEIHGGQNLSTPLLMPKSKYYDGVDTCVKLMTHSGSVVSIPHDLRVPFARYVAWNGVTSFRRYSIERVYREKRIFGFIPRELYECAFDIVTSTPGNFMSDAEILYILNEVIDQVPGFKNRNLHIRMNHTLLLKAILVHCGVKDKHSELYDILSDAREGKGTKQQVRHHLVTMGLSDNSIDLLFSFLEAELSVSKMACHMQIITKKRSSEASQYAKQALQELRAVVQNAEALGVTFNMVICPGLVYNIHQYSGMLCQLVCEIKKKHRHGMDVLAAGGRYDSMISNYRGMMVHANMSSRDIRQSAVGVSISLDKLMQAMEKDEESDGKRIVYLDAVICSLGGNQMLKEKSSVLRSLWAVGIRSCLIDAVTSEDIQEQCGELNVPHVIILKDSEPGQVKVRSWENDRFQERRFKLAELVESMQRIIKSGNEGNFEATNSYYNLSRSDSKISHGEHNQDAYVNIRFVTMEKLPANTRKKFENQIRSQMASVFKKLIGDVMLLAVNLEGAVVKLIASYLDFDSEEAFYDSVKQMKERNQKHKDYIREICDEIYLQKGTKGSPVIVLYSISDFTYKVFV